METIYKNLDINIEMGTKYLINENAYFLGGIFAANESVTCNNVKYWIAPVRHNSGQITSEELEQHFLHVKKISEKLNNQTLMSNTIKSNGLDSGKFKRLIGFGTFFKTTIDSSLEELIPEIRKVLFNSPNDVKRSFIVGMFDGRGSFDRNSQTGAIRYLSLDCENSVVGHFLCDVLKDFGFDFNYNTARDRVKGGPPRKDQLRIPGNQKFIEKIGFISIKKFSIGIGSYVIPSEYTILNEDIILDGLKRIVKNN